MLGRGTLMGADCPDNIPNLFGNQRLMGVLHQNLLFLRHVNHGFVLIRNRGGLVRQGVPQIDNVVQKVFHRGIAPEIGSVHVHLRGFDTVFTVVIMPRRENFFLGEHPGNLGRALAAGTEGEDSLDDRGSFFIGNQIFAVCIPLLVAVGNPTAGSLTTLALGHS